MTTKRRPKGILRNGAKHAARPAAVLTLSTTRPPRPLVSIDGTLYELRWRDELDPRHALRAELLAPRMRALAAALEASELLSDAQAGELVAGVRELTGYVLDAPAEVAARLTDAQCMQLIARYGMLQLERAGAGG